MELDPCTPGSCVWVHRAQASWPKLSKCSEEGPGEHCSPPFVSEAFFPPLLHIWLSPEGGDSSIVHPEIPKAPGCELEVSVFGPLLWPGALLLLLSLTGKLIAVVTLPFVAVCIPGIRYLGDNQELGVNRERMTPTCGLWVCGHSGVLFLGRRGHCACGSSLQTNTPCPQPG